MCYYYKFAAAIALAVGALHPAAMSHLNLKFSDNEVVATLKLQELTLREVTHFKIDANGDEHITQVEFENAWPQIDSLLQSTFWFEASGERITVDFTPIEYLGDVHLNDIVLVGEPGAIRAGDVGRGQLSLLHRVKPCWNDRRDAI